METHSKCLIIVAAASAMLLATCCWQHTTHSVAVCLPLEVDELHLDGERERETVSETECAHCNAVLVAAADDNYDDDDNDDFSSCCHSL